MAPVKGQFCDAAAADDDDVKQKREQVVMFYITSVWRRRPVFSHCFHAFVMYKTLPIKVLFCQISMLSDIAHHVLCCSTNCGGESGNQVVRT